MKRKQRMTLLLVTIVVGVPVLAFYLLHFKSLSLQPAGKRFSGSADYSGSLSCRECHEDFYRLWATSHHGLAMQPFTAELFQSSLTSQTEKLVIGDAGYHVEFDGRRAWIKESGPEGNRSYPMVHALGGKNVYYFLTPMDRGRLQVLPLAYDVRESVWFDTAASGIRHFSDIEEEPVDWKDQEYTFNTSCYGCHVSQFERNYDPATDTYHSVWLEPGINCEACHGSAVEHVRVFQEADAKGTTPADPMIETIIPPKYSRKIASDACSVCHAKASPLTASYLPGDDFFDHFDLGVLELPDYYPDGRDLGENYTYTQWLMSPCAKSGQMDCLHCHTSSGRYRFADDAQQNNACMPCHAAKVKDPAGHSRHPEGSAGSRCISCHMPMTEFARMTRSDHSMLPPAPSATMAFSSPNACNICHADKDAGWADEWVRKWRTRDYQAPVLHRASLIDAARRRNWEKLPAMLDYVERDHADNYDEVFAASLIRLMRPSDDGRKWPVLIHALQAASPLVRASAAESLGGRLDPESVKALGKALKDESRLVRVRAAFAMAPVPRRAMDSETTIAYNKAVKEFEATVDARPDHWSSHYNMGSFYLAQGDYSQAAVYLETAIRLGPRNIMPYVNVSFAYNALGSYDKAEQSLSKAVEIDPESLEANLNLGLLLGDMGRIRKAEAYLQKASDLNTASPVAAYNLGLIQAQQEKLDPAIENLRQACRLQPENPRYCYSLAFYLEQRGDTFDSADILRQILKLEPSHLDALFLLGDLYLRQGKTSEVHIIYQEALSHGRLPPEVSRLLEKRISALPE